MASPPSAMAQALRLNLALGPQLTELADAMALNEDAMTTLRETLPKASKIKPTYVHAEFEQEDLALPLKGATISVLGPEQDIDFYYLGDEGDPVAAPCPGIHRHGPAAPCRRRCRTRKRLPAPANIDPADFRQLRSRMLSTALAFADLDGKVCNNTSVVLLIEWKGKRLLFVGDAEWDGGFKKGKKANCSWNVMWNLRKKQLDGPLAFLQDRPSWQRQRHAVGTDGRGQQGRAAGHSRCDPSRGVEGEGQGGRFDASGQLSRRSRARTFSRKSASGSPTRRTTPTAFKKAGSKTSDRAEVRRVREGVVRQAAAASHRSRAHAQLPRVHRRGDRSVRVERHGAAISC